MANFSQNYTVAGLETLTIPMGTAGNYTLSGKLTLPNTTASGSASTVVTTIKQNGSTIFTTLSGASGFSIPLQAASGDSITVALTSSTASDEVLNAVRCDVSIG